MKISIVGSPLRFDNPLIQDKLKQQLQELKPTVVFLPKTKLFNTKVKDFLKKNGFGEVFVYEMNPPKPTWLGPAAQSVQKANFRMLQAAFIAKQVEALVVIPDSTRPGISYTQIVHIARLYEKSIVTL